MLPFIGRPRRSKSARSHRNTVSSQRLNMVTFNEAVDPLAVNTSSVNVQLSNGDTLEGSYAVKGTALGNAVSSPQPSCD